MSEFKMPVGHHKMPHLVYNIYAKAIIHKCHLDVNDRTFVFVVAGSDNYDALCTYIHNVFTTVGLTSVKSADSGKGFCFLRLDNGCCFRIYDDKHFTIDNLRGMAASYAFNRALTEDEYKCLHPVMASSATSFLLEVGV